MADEPTLGEVRTAIDDVMRTVKEYHDTNDKRIDDIESKGKADPLTDDVLARMDAALDAKLVPITQRAAALEVASQRPDLGTDGEAVSTAQAEQTLALAKWLRTKSPGVSDFEIQPIQTKALNTFDDESAGYLLKPAEFDRQIIKDVTDISPIRQFARVRPVAAKEFIQPKRTGQFAALWVEEAGTRAETTGLTYGQEKIVNHTMVAQVNITHEMMRDSGYPLEGILREEFAEQFAKLEGTAFVNGTGSHSPEGISVNAGIGSTNSEAAATLTADGLIALQMDVDGRYADVGRWFCRRATISIVRRLKTGDGAYLMDWEGIVRGAAPTILGRPYTECPDIEAADTNTYPLYFGDMRDAYTITDRLGMQLQRDPFTAASTGTVVFRAYRSVGGQVVHAEAIRKQQCAVT